MKTFSFAAFIAIAAVAWATTRPEIFVSAVLVIGLGGIIALDYGRAPRPLQSPVTARSRGVARKPFRAPPLPAETHQLAA